MDFFDHTGKKREGGEVIETLCEAVCELSCRLAAHEALHHPEIPSDDNTTNEKGKDIEDYIKMDQIIQTLHKIRTWD